MAHPTMKSLKTQSLLYFLPSVFNWTLPLVMLPITTLILNPDDFGKYALVTAVTTFGTALASLASGYIIFNNYSAIDHKNRQWMISTMLVVGMIILLVFASIVGMLSLLSVILTELLPQERSLYLGISLLSIIFSFPWTALSNNIITLEQNAEIFSKVTIVLTLLHALILIFLLLVARFKTMSLFLADAITNFFYCVISLVLLKSLLRPDISKHWLKKILIDGFVMTIPNLVASVQSYIERVFISKYAGMDQLGIYMHSKRYVTILGPAMKSVGRSVWPQTLQYARENNRTFPITMQTWNLLYSIITIAGIAFITFGKEFIALLTHNKFTSAYMLAVLWFIHLLCQNMQQPQLGILYGRGHGKLYSNMHLAALCLSMMGIILTVPHIGPIGVFVSFMIQELFFRFSITLFCWKKYAQPSFDYWAWLGLFWLSITFTLCTHFNNITGARFGIGGLSMALYCLVARRHLNQILKLFPARKSKV